MIVGASVWGVTEVTDSPGFARLLLCLALSLILVTVGWLVYRAMRIEANESEPSLLETPLRLARDDEVFKRYQELSRSLLRISWQNDPIYRELALQQLAATSERIRNVAQGEITFRDTEVWRLAYEQLLRSPGLYQYRSVSWMTTDSYWQDEPGRQSLKLNMELHERQQIMVERIVILKDSDWLNDRDLPAPKIRQWIHEQHVHGIWIALVRESQLQSESDLLEDFGIYGSRAVGFQRVDDHARTKSFVLKFDINAIEEAESRWKRLQVYATAYDDLLDHLPLDE
jgi:hypothetical protein